MTKIITPTELAQMLNVSTRTLSRWHNHRIGPARTKVGNFIGYRQESVELWLEKNETHPR
ncbi:MAG: helix-turn-helix domain-containing protein [Micavibrio sp.]